MSQTQYLAAQYLTALSHHRAGELAQAESLYQQVLNANPKHADALHILGVVYYQTDRAEQAVKLISQALAINPKNTDYLNHYALSLRAANQPEAAIRSFQQAVLLQPKDLDIQFNLANTLLTLNRFEEALQFNKQDAAIYYNLGNAQRELGKPAEAAKQYAQAIQLAPDDADIYNNLGNVQRELGQLDLAIASYQKALVLNPQLDHAKVHLVHQKQHICDWHGLTDDITEIRNWVHTQPQAQISPFAFLAMPGTTAAEQKLCADNWVKNRYASAMELGRQSGFTAQEKPAGEKIKIGYMSADFRLHPLAFLISELLELHDRSQFEIIGFSYGADDKSDARKRIQKAFNAFHDIRRLTDNDAATLIHDCDIDILVDLTGFTQNSRCGIVALRPAPITISWLGFPGTMGSYQDKPLFDYLLTDNFITPPEAASNYAEQLALLPHSYQPNDRKRPVAKTPSRAECSLPDNAFVFCCFNQTFKITEDFFNCWMRLLKATPNSVLWLLECNRWAKQNLIEQAALHGILSERLIFAPRVSIAEHLARHAHADLFLDTLPYNAHTTCSDALWMGLPVLTCVGDTFASRVAGSLLKAAGLDELITYTLADYENKALFLAANTQAQDAMKQKLLREKMTSDLFDTAKFARSLEAIYKDIQANQLNQEQNI